MNLTLDCDHRCRLLRKITTCNTFCLVKLCLSKTKLNHKIMTIILGMRSKISILCFYVLSRINGFKHSSISSILSVLLMRRRISYKMLKFCFILLIFYNLIIILFFWVYLSSVNRSYSLSHLTVFYLYKNEQIFLKQKKLDWLWKCA